MANTDYLSQARNVLDIERAAIDELYGSLDEKFTAACELMMHCQGRVVVTGMGKSGHIGGKIAATLASTGTPAFFVHPGEASHGDLGMITKQDVVLAISNSGETGELVSIIPVLKRLNVPMIAMTGRPDSTLATLADVHIKVAVKEEACPLGLAPTASTTATLVMGDALAVSLLRARGFTADDFALSHPGGSLGKRLLLHVNDLMHAGERVPVVPETAIISEALLEMSRKGLGMTTVVDANQKLSGLFTDGDLRRILDQRVDVHKTSIKEVMTQGCVTVKQNLLAAEALQLMESRKINGLIVVDEEHRPVGAFNMQDMLQAGVI
ncbi:MULTISPECIES: KpsF/GutQ family sugar-phosphate isomerase [Gammaproteobacteria]|uniref:KpsF/GutQ family sugar-phosphate isomerase n=1 Tax=Gammaproteobacteria TaxID=1236 RepID=UPI000DD00D55|nr:MULTISPECIES: KpsF/GutQ family sugar-phosphate isomerase [Gammaproteobacteria]RTE86348.1 KpsF/GutQ family sugar-phosphate isomerase [Aliidiomarina sp. B3213]TCZ91698.1 KpsF/GutQ family sugar-phosphate isomerase [Lysobacter sp. N42]